jgi:hypothetical protein
VVRRADEPVMVKQVCGELGISLEPARSEALRSELNRLAERGWLRKPADGKVHHHAVSAPGGSNVMRLRP